MDEAERLADHVVVVEAGRAVAAGAVGELAAAEPGLAFEAEPGLPVEQLAGAVGRGTTVRETTPGHYVVDGTTDAASVAAVTAWCAERGVLLARVETRRRSLEDVFLELTGGRP
jgi:ABC-2 type transport system ATP-binding protein